MRGAPPGDLYLFLNIPPHPLFQREGADIYCRVPLEMVTASLGGAIEVPTIEGKRAKVSVPAGTQTGRQFRLRGKGMSVLRSPSRGEITLKSADPAEAPRIFFNYMSTDQDWAAFRHCLRLPRELFSQPAFAPYRGTEIQPGHGCQRSHPIDPVHCHHACHGPANKENN